MNSYKNARTTFAGRKLLADKDSTTNLSGGRCNQVKLEIQIHGHHDGKALTREVQKRVFILR
jgi:hypothetical protein